MDFAYNTTVHRTIKVTPFMLTYWVEHRTPVFSSHPSYGEDFAGELHQKFKSVHQLAANHTEKATTEYSKEHYKKSILHNHKEGRLVLRKIFDMKNKNSKLAEKWQGMYKVIKLLGQGTLEVKRLDWKENSRVVNVAILKLFKQLTAEPIEQPAPLPTLPCSRKKRERRVHVPKPKFERFT
jgi:hypothetical protein